MHVTLNSGSFNSSVLGVILLAGISKLLREVDRDRARSPISAYINCRAPRMARVRGSPIPIEVERSAARQSHVVDSDPVSIGVFIVEVVHSLCELAPGMRSHPVAVVVASVTCRASNVKPHVVFRNMPEVIISDKDCPIGASSDSSSAGVDQFVLPYRVSYEPYGPLPGRSCVDGQCAREGSAFRQPKSDRRLTSSNVQVCVRLRAGDTVEGDDAVGNRPPSICARNAFLNLTGGWEPWHS